MPGSMHSMTNEPTYRECSRYSPRYKRIGGGAPLNKLKAGLREFWAFAKRAGFREVAKDLLLAALIAAIGL